MGTDMKFLAALGRIAVTLVVVLVAVVIGRQIWTYYVDDPWTRDGRVRADVVGVAPDVTGPVVEVMVHDEQAVHIGDVLFRVDPARFDLALQQADAVVAPARPRWTRRCATSTATTSSPPSPPRRRSRSRPTPPCNSPVPPTARRCRIAAWRS